MINKHKKMSGAQRRRDALQSRKGGRPVKREHDKLVAFSRELEFCSRCGIVYYQKTWHHNLRDFPGPDPDKSVRFTLCPACKMAKEDLCEGEVHVAGVVPHKKELMLNTIKNIGTIAYRRDPLDRVLRIVEQKDGIIVYTSENQLAVRIGKKLRHIFNGKADIKYGGDGKAVRVSVVI